MDDAQLANTIPERDPVRDDDESGRGEMSQIDSLTAGRFIPEGALVVATVALVSAVALELYRDGDVLLIGSTGSRFYVALAALIAVTAASVTILGVLTRAREAGRRGANILLWLARITTGLVSAAIFLALPVVGALESDGYARLEGTTDYAVRIELGLGQWPVTLLRSDGWLRYERVNIDLPAVDSPQLFEDGGYTVSRHPDGLLLEFPSIVNEHEQIALPVP